MPMSAATRKITPAARLKSRKATVSNAIQNATARLPNTVNVFGNSMVSLIFFASQSGLIVKGGIRSFQSNRLRSLQFHTAKAVVN